MKYTKTISRDELLRIKDRLYSKIHKGPGCWIWKGHFSRDHAQFKVSKKLGSYYAIRLILLLEEIDPQNKHVLHKPECGDSRCVNPSHVYLGEQSENMLDYVASDKFSPKTHCLRGHEYTPINTYYQKGKRSCKACRTARNRKQL